MVSTKVRLTAFTIMALGVIALACLFIFATCGTLSAAIELAKMGDGGFPSIVAIVIYGAVIAYEAVIMAQWMHCLGLNLSEILAQCRDAD